MNFPTGRVAVSAAGTRYQALVKLGRGANSSTFLVIDTSGTNQGVPFAMKVFERVSRPDRQDSFLREVEILKSCDHPSIMRVFDNGMIEDKYPFLIAEYLPNTLAKVIEDKTASIVQKQFYAMQLLSGLRYLASLQTPIIHRDVKPANIFIKGHSCVLGDFGLAKILPIFLAADDREDLKKSLGAGMPFAYRTPDLVEYLVNGKQPTVKSDVFQAGLVIAELFTGKNPEIRAGFTDPVELEQLETIKDKMASPILDLIRSMLVIDADSRPDVSTLVAAWRGLLLEAVHRHTISGGPLF